MKDLIKQQEEDFDKKLNEVTVNGGFQLIGYEKSKENLEAFISKVRKETAEYVCDEMIGRKLDENCKYDMGYNFRIELEKEIKQNILKEFK